jgi:hypothetical protein
MRLIMTGMLVLIMIVKAGGLAGAQPRAPATVLTNCKAEIEAYCADIMPGEDRLAACLYANEYKLSPRCEQSLFDAANELERAVADVTYVVNECRADIANYCSKTGAGEGRLMACLDKNRQRLSARCKLALQDVGAKK